MGVIDIVLAIAFAGKALTKLANFAALGILNKLLGGVFGALKIALILSVVLNIFDKFNNAVTLLDEDTKQDSALYKPVKSLVPMIFPNLLNLNEEETPETNANKLPSI